MKKINSASEALEVFNAKFAGLIGEVKGEFKKRFIQTPGREYLAYVLPDDKRETMYIVPFHTEEKPCIEKYENVKIVQEIRSADEAVKAFVFEFGSLARAINPAAPAFDGYRFKKHLIKIREGNMLVADILSGFFLNDERVLLPKGLGAVAQQRAQVFVAHRRKNFF